MATDPKDPWSTGDRAGYSPPQTPKRIRQQQNAITLGGILRTVLVIVALLWAFNYAWQHYFSAK